MLKERGASTLGGISVWYDDEIRRLNTDGRGELLGEFSGDDRLIVMTGKGLYYTTGYDLGVHFPEETIRVEKYDPGRIYSVVYFDGEQNYYYVKRFTAEPSDRMQSFVERGGRSVARGDQRRPLSPAAGRLCGTQCRPADDTIDVDEFIGVKSHRAKGKRVTTLEVGRIVFTDPIEREPRPEEPSGEDDPGDGSSGEGAGTDAASAGASGKESRRRKSPSSRITWRAIRSSSTWPAKKRRATGDKWNCFERRLAGDGRPSFRKGLPFDECCARAVRTARRRGLGAC